ncbi:DUF4333 domain-containing protein [Saccharothrix sp. AJ9571]|nr:DUF4333 domain-containing protein [Saccharothrix sp. AJ9571]
MSTPYGGNDPQQWAQQPGYGGGTPQGTPSGGFPAQPPQPGYPQQGGYPQQQPGYEQQGYPQQQPGYPQTGPQPQYGQQPGGYPQQQQPAYDPNQPQPGYDPNQQQYAQQQPGYPQTGPQPQYGQTSQYDFAQQQPGYPGQPGQPQESGKKSGKALWIGLGAVVVIALVAVALLVWPAPFNKKVFDNVAMQDAVRKVLTENYQVQGVEGVTCPESKEVKNGTGFDCEAKIGGATKMVPIKVVNEADGTYEVGTPK